MIELTSSADNVIIRDLEFSTTYDFDLNEDAFGNGTELRAVRVNRSDNTTFWNNTITSSVEGTGFGRFLFSTLTNGLFHLNNTMGAGNSNIYSGQCVSDSVYIGNTIIGRLPDGIVFRSTTGNSCSNSFRVSFGWNYFNISATPRNIFRHQSTQYSYTYFNHLVNDYLLQRLLEFLVCPHCQIRQ